MATKKERVDEWCRSAGAALRAWVEESGPSRAELSRRLGVSPTRVGRCLNQDHKDFGSPAFVKMVQEHYAEWRPLWLEYRAIEDGVEVDREAQACAADVAKRLARVRELKQVVVDAFDVIIDEMSK